jgi:lauroyl-Kdo2-lipid IVA myristoyltransferase
MKKDRQDKSQFIPRFKVGFLHPRYWGKWLAVTITALLALLPPRWRDPVLAALGRNVGKVAGSARQRAQVNLSYCFPELSVSEREKLIDKMFATAPQSIVMMAELAIRGHNRLRSRLCWQGKEILEAQLAAGENIILLVPHGWAIDIPAMLLAAEGHPIAGMFHHQKDEFMDYVWNSLRLRFGGRIHARESGIKPFIDSVRQGYLGYYLPDEDHGPEQSQFVDFFATYKATLPTLGRLVKVCRAKVIPLFPVYDANTHKLTINVLPVMEGLDQDSPQRQARRMNEEVENLVGPHPEQYTWILKLLKTRKSGEADPY